MVAPDSGTAPARRSCSRGLSFEIGILALLLYLAAVSYACSRRRRHRRRRRRGAVAEDQEVGGMSDAAIVYEQQADTQTALDCAVCLGQVEAGDKVRLLPKCVHLFHADYVGAWLRLHSTCPMCRAATTDATPAAARALPPGVAPGVQAGRMPWEA